jgi:hypothetical protein
MPEHRRTVIHDGQSDAMPCQCPACRSPFITTRIIRNPADIAPHARIEAPARDHLDEARAC